MEKREMETRVGEELDLEGTTFATKREMLLWFAQLCRLEGRVVMLVCARHIYSGYIESVSEDGGSVILRNAFVTFDTGVILGDDYSRFTKVPGDRAYADLGALESVIPGKGVPTVDSK